MLISEKAHLNIFLIGITIMLAGVAVIIESTAHAPWVMFAGGGIAITAMASQTVKYLRTGEM